MSSDGKILYTGGHWDCSIKIYTISSKIKIAGVVIKHFGKIKKYSLIFFLTEIDRIHKI